MGQNVKFYYWKYGTGEKYLMIKTRAGEMEQWAANCGDNCFPAMARIGKIQDIKVKFSHCLKFLSDDMEAQFTNTGEIARGNKETGLGITKKMDWEAGF